MKFDLNYLNRFERTAAVDSFTVVIPIDFCLLSDHFNDVVMHVSLQTGEVLEEKKRDVIYDNYGIKIRGFVVTLFDKRYLNLQLSSKTLRRNYLRGIDCGNIREVFNFAQKALGFICSFQEFMKHGRIYDLDFKIDFDLNDRHFNDFALDHKELVNVRLFKGSEAKYLTTNYFTGFQFVNRNDSSISKPFVKFYTKKLELQKRSQEFFLTNNISVSPTLRRLECTLKNKMHLSKFNLENSPIHVFSISPKRITEIIFMCYFRHVGKVIHIPSQKEHLSIQCPFTLNTWFINNLIFWQLRSTNQGFNCIVQELLDTYPRINPQSKSRRLTQLKKDFKEFLPYCSLNSNETMRETSNDLYIVKSNPSNCG